MRDADVFVDDDSFHLIEHHIMRSIHIFESVRPSGNDRLERKSVFLDQIILHWWRVRSQNQILSARIFFVEIDGVMHLGCRMRKRDIHRFEVFEFRHHFCPIFHDEAHGLADFFSISPDFRKKRIGAMLARRIQTDIYEIFFKLLIYLSHFEMLLFSFIRLSEFGLDLRQLSASLFLLFRSQIDHHFEFFIKKPFLS